MQPLVSRLVPFLMLGIAIVAFIFGMVLLAYLFVFGALVGIVLFTISLIRSKLSPPKKDIVKRSGRTFEHDDK